MKKLLLVLAALGLMTQISGCTASQPEGDAEFVENANADKIESEEPTLDDGSSETASSENLTTDNSLESALNEQPAETAAPTDEAAAAPIDPPAEDIAAAPPADDMSLDNPPAEPPAESLAESDLPPSDLSLDDPNALAPADDLSASADQPAATPQDPPATEISAATPTPVDATPTTPVAETKPTGAGTTSLKKITDAVPYAFGDGFVNAIYIARPKETLKEISQKIYGTDKTKELKKINSFLKARSPRAGDKIAYVSPNRPTDSSKTMTYYEETGMIPETYVAQKGDNLRKVAKKLLGYENAWKEIWSTNPLETKTKLAEGETFRYWKSPASITPPTDTAATGGMPKSAEDAVNNIVRNNSQPPVEATPPQQGLNDLPPPPSGGQADLPPPPADPMAATGATDPALDASVPPPPPPPDDSQFASPPPPPPDMPNKSPAAEEGDEMAEGGEDNTMALLGIVAVVLAAGALFIAKRKKAQANADMPELGT